MNGDPNKAEMTPQEYVERGRRILQTIERFKRLRTRIYRSLNPQEEGKKKGALVDEQICCVYAQAHFTPPEKLFKERKLEVAFAWGELLDLMDEIGAGVK